MTYLVGCNIHLCVTTGLPLTMLFCMIDARTTFPNISADFVLRSAMALPVSPEVDALINDEWIRGQLTPRLNYQVDILVR